MRGWLAPMAATLFIGTATAATKPPGVVLTFSVIGSGTVQVTQQVRGRTHLSWFACKQSSCRQAVRVHAGSRVAITATPATRWKFAKWGGACEGSAAKCSLRVTRAARVGVTFAAPGTQANPIPVGTTATIDGFWYLGVNSSGQQGTNLVVSLTATATHSSSLILAPLDLNIFVYGGLGAYGIKSNHCTDPSPDFLLQGKYGFSGMLEAPEGQPITGYLCFQVPAGSTYLLFTEPPLREGLNASGDPPYPPDAQAVWFALR